MVAEFKAPIVLTDAELDAVTGGLINLFVDADDILSRNNIQVAVPVNASVAANVLTNDSVATSDATQTGRIRNV